jgi:N-acetyl-gamma-glutamyl-phosphate reductase
MTATIFIDGEAGTTGLGIRDRLAGMAGIALKSLEGEARKDPDAKRTLFGAVDVVILCLPDAAAKESAALADSLGQSSPKLLDASSAHRVAPGWVYGFPELQKGQAQAIATARRVANPGCYATGAIALLRPLVDAGLLPRDYPVTINAVSGYSGGGKAMIGAYEAGAAPNFELYALGLAHKHLPEITVYSGLTREPLFVPSVANFRQGMLVSIPLHLDTLPGRPSGSALAAALSDHYRGAAHISVVADPSAQSHAKLAAEELNDTNDMELYVVGNPQRAQALLVAKLDNLGKGASAAAVQNLRLMLGLV